MKQNRCTTLEHLTFFLRKKSSLSKTRKLINITSLNKIKKLEFSPVCCMLFNRTSHFIVYTPNDHNRNIVVTCQPQSTS